MLQQETQDRSQDPGLAGSPGAVASAAVPRGETMDRLRVGQPPCLQSLLFLSGEAQGVWDSSPSGERASDGEQRRGPGQLS